MTCNTHYIVYINRSQAFNKIILMQRIFCNPTKKNRKK